MVKGVAARCGSGAGDVPVTRMWCEWNWVRTWKMHRKWCGEMLMGDTAEKALAVVVGPVVTRMVHAGGDGGRHWIVEILFDVLGPSRSRWFRR